MDCSDLSAYKSVILTYLQTFRKCSDNIPVGHFLYSLNLTNIVVCTWDCTDILSGARSLTGKFASLKTR